MENDLHGLKFIKHMIIITVPSYEVARIMGIFKNIHTTKEMFSMYSNVTFTHKESASELKLWGSKTLPSVQIVFDNKTAIARIRRKYVKKGVIVKPNKNGIVTRADLKAYWMNFECGKKVNIMSGIILILTFIAQNLNPSAGNANAFVGMLYQYILILVSYVAEIGILLASGVTITID